MLGFNQSAQGRPETWNLVTGILLERRDAHDPEARTMANPAYASSRLTEWALAAHPRYAAPRQIVAVYENAGYRGQTEFSAFDRAVLPKTVIAIRQAIAELKTTGDIGSQATMNMFTSSGPVFLGREPRILKSPLALVKG